MKPTGQSPDAGRECATWLELEPDPVFAVLHTPAVWPGRRTSVLICPPFGWEEECSHRGLANSARALASAGFATARIDFPGTRNSVGGPSARRLGPWKAAVSGSATWLREISGAARLAVFGIGLGGLVACAAALDGAPVDDLILWSVPAEGRSLMRELRMHARVISARHPNDSSASATAGQGSVEAIGYRLEDVALREFGEVRLAEHPLPRASRRRVLLLKRDGRGFDAELEEHFARSGAAVSRADGNGYAGLMEDPQFSRPPQQTISETIAWLECGEAETVSEGGEPASEAGESAAGPGRHARDAYVEFAHGDARIRETAIKLEGPEGALFAIVAEPSSRDAEPLCAVLLSSGSLSHVGPNRTWVELARRWAAAGVSTVRVDFPGIGEAQGDGERYADNAAFYTHERIEAALDLLDRLEGRGLPPRFVLTGLCSGAYWALQAALRDDRVAGALMLNLWSFFFSEELAVERQPGEALSRLRGEGLGRLLRRDVSAEKLEKAIRSIAPRRILRGARHEVERSQTAQITSALDQLRDQGTEALLLFGSDEPLHVQLEREGFLDRLDRWPNLRVEPIPSRDHMFRALRLQRYVHERLDDALARVQSRVGSVTRT